MTFRIRLTLLFVTAMAVLATMSSTAVYVIAQNRLAAQDRHAARTLATTAALADSAEVALDRIAASGDLIWLVGPNGRVLAKSYRAPGTTLADVRAAVIAGTENGMLTASAPISGGGRAIVLHTTAPTAATLSTIRLTLIYVDVAVVAGAALLGTLLASRALRPVERMRSKVDSIGGDELERRLPEGRADELGRLAHAFNRLLQRAQTASFEQQQFIADASHELRTPAMAIEGHARILGRALQRGDLDRAASSAQVVEQSSHRLALTVRELLSLAEADAAHAGNDDVRLDLIAKDAVSELHATAPAREIRTSLTPLEVRGDAFRLREMLMILVDNADKYSPPDAPVAVHVGRDPTGAGAVSIRDFGPGLGPDDPAVIFRRFARGTASPGVAGSGLGLAIARAIADRHGATLTLESALGGGAIATVRFSAPVAASPPRDESGPRQPGRT